MCGKRGLQERTEGPWSLQALRLRALYSNSLMDGLHIPAWDGTSGLFEEYPSAAAFPAAKAAKGAGKSEKILRREQERLQTMINGVVILSAPTGDTAGMHYGCYVVVYSPSMRTFASHGPHTKQLSYLSLCFMAAEGVSDDTASLAQRKTKKRKTGSKGESGDTAARGQTRDDKVHSSVQAVLGSNGQTRDLVPIQKQTQLGKRKAPDLAAIGKDIEPHQLPESKASQQEGAHKKRGADNIKKQEEKAALYLGSAAASDAAQAAREGDVRRDANHSASKQALQNSLARDISQPAEGVKKKRSRNKFKQEDLVAQHVLPKSSESMATVQDSTAQSQPAEAVREKRDRTQFKQYDVSAQEVVPNSSQGKVRVQEFTAGSQPVEPVKKKRNRNKFKQDEAPAQQMLPDSSALKAMLPEPVEESQPSEPVIKNRNRNKVRQNEMPTQQVLRMSSEGNAKKQDPAGQYQPAAEVRKRRNRNKFKQDDASDQHVVPTSLAVKDTVQQDESAKVRNKAKQEVFAQPQAKSAALQSDETQERQARKQMKGVNAIAKADAAGSAQQSRVTGKVRKEEAIPSSQRAAGASRQKDDGLLSKMRAKLAGSQFRWLNEQLYTCPGDQAFELMQEQPHLFTQYHEVRSPAARSSVVPKILR